MTCIDPEVAPRAHRSDGENDGGRERERECRSRPRIGPRVRAAGVVGGGASERTNDRTGGRGRRRTVEGEGTGEEEERKHLKNYPNSQEGRDSSPARAAVPRPTPNTY